MSRPAADIMAARPRVIAALAAQFRDLDLAEESFSQACEKLLAQSEPPDDVAAWLYAAGRRKAIDQLRKNKRQAQLLARDIPQDEGADMGDIIAFPEAIPDERLRLIFICCHPALALEARTALALKIICGLPVAEIARLFVTSEPAMYQRITRAKAKVHEAGIAFEMPHRRQWDERLEAVLLTLELAYTAVYREALPDRPGTADGKNALADEVERFALILAELLPEEAEVLGLAALVLLARSRESARVDADGARIPLSQQDVALWDRRRIHTASHLLEKAADLGEGGAYQLMAAVHLTHARRADSGTTDWGAIAGLYEALAMLRPDPVIALNHALAVSHARSPAEGLELLDRLPQAKLAQFQPCHAARGDMCERAGLAEDARESFTKALALTSGEAERLYLEKRLAALPRPASG